MGFRFLYAAHYIDREMDIWFHVRVYLYLGPCTTIYTRMIRNAISNMWYI